MHGYRDILDMFQMFYGKNGSMGYVANYGDLVVPGKVRISVSQDAPRRYGWDSVVVWEYDDVHPNVLEVHG